MQTSFQYLLIVLGLLVVALAAWMAKENMWWIAIPDACFGIGVAWFAWIAISDHGAAAVPATASGPALDELPSPAPLPASSSSHLPDQPAPGPVAASVAPAPPPLHSKKKKKRRH